jgi:hypothetical protein
MKATTQVVLIFKKYKNKRILSAVGRGFQLRSGKTENDKIDICCFSAKHAALRRKSRD